MIALRLAPTRRPGCSRLGTGNPQGYARECIINLMNATVTHDRTEETIEAKALWFCSLTLTERMDMLCAFTELLLMTNPRIVEQRNAQPIEGRVIVLELEGK